jgi:hypothetical protein
MLQQPGSVQQQNPLEISQGLKRLLLKLRWAGLDDDAEALIHKLENVAPDEAPVVEPADTD